MRDEQIRDFVARDYARVLRAVTVVCGDPHHAEDAMQEAIVDVWDQRREVDDLAGWVTVAAINRTRSRWRSQAAEQRALDRLARLGDDAPGTTSGPAEPSDGRLGAALASLSRSQREVVALHYLLDLSVAAVGERLGIADGTVKVHLHRARHALRATLAEPESGVEEVDRVVR